MSQRLEVVMIVGVLVATISTWVVGLWAIAKAMGVGQ